MTDVTGAPDDSYRLTLADWLIVYAILLRAEAAASPTNRERRLTECNEAIVEAKEGGASSERVSQWLKG